MVPLCECGDLAVVEDSFVSAQFVCGNKNEVSKPILCSCKFGFFVCNYLCTYLFSGEIL